MALVYEDAWRNISPYRQVRRRRVPAWTRVFPAGALAIGGIWTKPLAFAADAEGYINIKLWGFNGRFAISSPHVNCQFC